MADFESTSTLGMWSCAEPKRNTIPPKRKKKHAEIDFI